VQPAEPLPEHLLIIDDDTWVNPVKLVDLINSGHLDGHPFVGTGPINSPVAFGGGGYILHRSVLEALLQPANVTGLTDARAGYHMPRHTLDQVVHVHKPPGQHQRAARNHHHRRMLDDAAGMQDRTGAELVQHMRHQAAAHERTLSEAAQAAQPVQAQQPSWAQACAAAKAGGPWCYFHSDWAVADCILLATGGAVKPLTHVGGYTDFNGHGAGWGLYFLWCPEEWADNMVTCHYVGPEEMLARNKAMCAKHAGMPGCG
jgi:hypothetical protein